jgi:ABC-2 type transport system ATP-binding protein
MITVENLIYDYPGIRALDNISFSIKSGSITALVGPNGSGKTTLLKCITTLLTPYQGKIYVNGNNALNNPVTLKKDIGFLQDFFGLYDKLTIEQALTYSALAYRLRPNDIPARIDYLTNRLQLPNKKSKIQTLSRGMRQRIAIAQAIIHNPKVLFLDEPASGLDPEARYMLGELFKELNATGMTILVSSHILSELDRYAKNMLIIRKGKIVTHDTINSSEMEETGRILSLGIANYFPDLKEKINSFPGVNDCVVKENMITVKFTGNYEKQSEFLKYLINADIPVVYFRERQFDIQEHYLRTLNKEKD